MKVLTTEQFIYNANKVHDNKYEYPDEYVNSSTKIRIICPLHGEFWQNTSDHVNKKGCSICGGSKKSTISEFINKANKVHDNKYEYPDEYVNSSTKIKIICPLHGEFWQTPNNHISKKSGCFPCARKIIISKNLLSNNKFLKLANKVHDNKYEYPDEYVTSKTKIGIICNKHGKFYQRPGDHLNKKTGCPLCFKLNYSQKAISWLDKIAKNENIFIQHAENGGEYKIPSTNYRVDGYCKANNTIYEFYGDCWHGNLEIYNENEQCHPFTKESAGSLYIKTMNREQELINLDYNLITIWENKYEF